MDLKIYLATLAAVASKCSKTRATQVVSVSDASKLYLLFTSHFDSFCLVVGIELKMKRHFPQDDVKVKIEIQPDEEPPKSVQDQGPHSIIDLGSRQIEALESEFLTDVTILVGGEVIKCHSLLLSFASAKLAGILKESEPILDVNVDPLHFRLLLQIIYTGRTTKPQDVASLLRVGRVAHNLQVPVAVAFCASNLAQKVTAENLWEIVDFANLISDDQLEEACFKMIRFQADFIIQTDAFLNCTIIRLRSILRQDTLFNVSELQLFQACVAWANSRSDEAESRRAALESALRLIRFRTFSAEDFAKHVCPTGLLGAEDERDIFRSCVTGENFMPVGFSLTKSPRDPAGRPIEIRFPSSHERKALHKFLETSTEFTIILNRDVFVLEVSMRACRLTIPHGILYEENVCVTLQGKDTYSFQEATCVGKVKNGDMFRIKLKQPFEIYRFTKYTLHVGYSRTSEGKPTFQLYTPSTIKGATGLEFCTLGEALAPPDLQLIVADKFTT